MSVQVRLIGSLAEVDAMVAELEDAEFLEVLRVSDSYPYPPPPRGQQVRIYVEVQPL